MVAPFAVFGHTILSSYSIIIMYIIAYILEGSATHNKKEIRRYQSGSQKSLSQKTDKIMGNKMKRTTNTTLKSKA